MDRDNIIRTAMYSLIVIVAVALVAGAAIAIARNMSERIDQNGSGSGTQSQTQEPSQEPSQEQTDGDGQQQTGADPNADGDSTPDSSSDGTAEPGREPDTEPSNVTTEPEITFTMTPYDEPIELYALYNVNARMKPTTSSDIMGMIYQSETVAVYGETDNGWYAVRYRGYEAYIRNDLLTDDAAAAAVDIETFSSSRVMYTTSDVNVRESYTTNSQIYEMLSAGVQVLVTGKTENGWYQIVYGESVAYVSDDHLSETQPVIEPDREA